VPHASDHHTLIERTPPPCGGLDFFIVPQLKAWSKRAPRKTTPKNWLKNNSIVFKKRTLFLRALYLDTTQQGNPPWGGGGSFRSTLSTSEERFEGRRGGKTKRRRKTGQRGGGGRDKAMTARFDPPAAASTTATARSDRMASMCPFALAVCEREAACSSAAYIRGSVREMSI